MKPNENIWLWRRKCCGPAGLISSKLMNIICGLIFHCIFITMASENVTSKPEVTDMAIANTHFALDLLRKFGTLEKNKNIFFAPYSITTALAMTYMGAKGSTADEMEKVLKWSSGAPTKGFGAYLPLLRKADSGTNTGYILVGVQRIYISGELALQPVFQSTAEKDFASDAIQANFSGKPEGERQTINSWVTEQTRGKIQDLLPQGSINELTSAVLVQAIYFKGNWMHKFDIARTKAADFYSPQGTVRVDMMEQTRNFMYTFSPELGCAAVNLPYASNNPDASDHDLSMLILLPEDRDGLDKLEASLTQEALQKIQSNLGSVKVNLKLPRFSVESSFALKDVLSSLGMPLAFSHKADFSGMVTGAGADLLYISEVFHKAVVEVNEEGTEAAAATGVVMMTRSMPIIHPFNVDHPFLYLIIDKRADIILFSGHVTNPHTTAQSKDEL